MEKNLKKKKYMYIYICITQSLSAHPNQHNIASQLHFNFCNAIKGIIGTTVNIDEENKVGGKLTVWFRSLRSLLGNRPEARV